AVVLVVYAAVLALTASQARWRPLVLASALLAVGGGLAAVQLLPTAAILHATDRAKLDYAAATSYSLPASHTPLLVFPYLFGGRSPTGHSSGGYRGAWELRELSGYVGAAALVLAAAGVAGARRDKRAVALLTVAGVCFVMALGSSTPIGRLVYALPIAGQFRAWGRYLAGVDLAVAILAGYGIAALRSSASARRAREAAIAGAGAVALGALREEVDIAATNGSRSVNGFDPLAPRDYLEAAGDMSYFGLVTTPAAFTRPQSHLLDLLRVSVVLDDDPEDRVAPRRWQREPA